MSNNCLVTKLKSSVNNESLSKLNVLTIKTKASESPTLDTQLITVMASNNGSISINSTNVGLYQSGISGELLPYPQTITANTVLQSHFENKNGIIEVTGKYNLSNLYLGDSATVRIKEIYGMTPGTIKGMIIRNIEEGEIDVTKLKNVLDVGKVTNIVIPTLGINILNRLSKNTIVEFKDIDQINNTFCSLFDSSIGLDDIANNVNISVINFFALNGGNLSSLAKMTKLGQLTFSDFSQNSGDIMDFINPWIQAGRTSGKIIVQYILGQSNITLNGQPITLPSGVHNEFAYLNWTSDGTVTFTAS